LIKDKILLISSVALLPPKNLKENFVYFFGAISLFSTLQLLHSGKQRRPNSPNARDAPTDLKGGPRNGMSGATTFSMTTLSTMTNLQHPA
jgi:hypothetical protein